MKGRPATTTRDRAEFENAYQVQNRVAILRANAA
jgi:hypothetical protein